MTVISATVSSNLMKKWGNRKKERKKLFESDVGKREEDEGRESV